MHPLTMSQLCLQLRQNKWFQMKLRPLEPWLVPTLLAFLLYHHINVPTIGTQVS